MELELREIHGVEEGAAMIALEERIWGVGEGMNRDLLTAMVHVGALAAGAFTADGEIVALLLGFPTESRERVGGVCSAGSQWSGSLATFHAASIELFARRCSFCGRPVDGLQF